MATRGPTPSLIGSTHGTVSFHIAKRKSACRRCKDDMLKVGKNLMVEAGDAIAFKTGKAKIVMEKDGTITIEGKNITISGKDIMIKGSGQIDVKASKNIQMKGKKILQN